MTVTSQAVRMTGRQRLVLVLLLGSQFMLAVDFSILNVALPVIGAGLGFALADLQWVATAFALAAAGFTLLFGRIADLFGRRRLFLGGMALLGLSSLAGGLATSPGLLLVARVAQGLATAAVTPAGLSLLTTSFPEGPLRARALGLNGALMSAGFTSGAILGGLLDRPAELAVGVLRQRARRARRPGRRPGPARREPPRGPAPGWTCPGAVTVTAGLLAPGVRAHPRGRARLADPAGIGALLAGAALLVAFWFVERRASRTAGTADVLAGPPWSGATWRGWSRSPPRPRWSSS